MVSFQFHQISIQTKDPKGLSDTVVTGMTIHWLREGSSLSHFPGAVRYNFQTPEILDTPTLCVTLHREIKNSVCNNFTEVISCTHPQYEGE